MTSYDMRISDWSSDVCSSDLNCKNRNDRHGAELGNSMPYTALSAISAGARVYLRPNCFIDTPSTLDGRVARMGNSLIWYHGYEFIVMQDRSEERRVGNGVLVRVDLGGGRVIKKNNTSTI